MEMALVAPFLLLLLLGIIEFGYLFAELNDVRHGAREGARLAAVNAGDSTFLRNTTCDSMDLTAGVSVEFTDGASGDIGDTGSVMVTAAVTPLTGAPFIDIFLPSTLESTVEFRLEQPSDEWSSFGPQACP